MFICFNAQRIANSSSVVLRLVPVVLLRLGCGSVAGGVLFEFSATGCGCVCSVVLFSASFLGLFLLKSFDFVLTTPIVLLPCGFLRSIPRTSCQYTAFILSSPSG